jgi:hypothetical protein
MMRASKAFGLLGCALLLVLSQPAFAHRMNAAMSLIEISPTNGRLEVTHSLFAHDLEGVLGAGSVRLDWFETPQGEAALRTYVERNFVLKAQNGRAIALTFIGIELRGDLINVYFDAPHYRGTRVTVDVNFLQEVSDTQVNQVNLRARGRTISAVFRAGAEPKTLVIPVG